MLVIMRRIAALIICAWSCAGVASAQSDSGFAGLWKWNASRSEVRSLPSPPDPFLKVDQNAAALTVGAASQSGGPFVSSKYPLDGTTVTGKSGDSRTSSQTKWEGAALLVNTLVSGPQNYTVMERWRRSRDGNTLTIRRTIVGLRGEVESTLLYENTAVTTQPELVTQDERRALAVAPPAEYTVEQGTHVLLRLTNSVDTKRTAVGDVLYLETAVPVFVSGKLIIPRGSYVSGRVTEAQQAGRVKGKGALNLRFESLTLPNGVARDLRSRAGGVDARGNVDRKEGRIEGEGNKGGDAGTVGRTTATGASVGTLAGAASGHYGMGAGIGAAAGAAAGLAGVLGSRGPGVVLPPGTTMELVLDRDLKYTAAELFR